MAQAVTLLARLTPHRKVGRRLGRSKIALACALAGLLGSSCSLFHRGPTPQEQYYSALARGDVVGATHIWMQMSPKDREKLVRGQGLSRKFRQELFRQQLSNYATSLGMPGAVAVQNPNAAK